jgi:chitodextrinase
MADAALAKAEGRCTAVREMIEVQRSQVEAARQTIARGAAGGSSPVTERSTLTRQLETMEDVMTLLRERLDDGVHCRPVTLQRALEMLDDLQVELDAMEGLGCQVVAAWCSLNLGRLARLDVTTEPACADPATRRAVDECTGTVDRLVLLYFELERDADADTIPNRRRTQDAICKVERLQNAIDVIASPRATMPHYHAQRRLLTCVCERLERGLNGLEPHEAVDRTRSSQATEVGLAAIPPGSFLCADVAADTVSLQWACPGDVFGRPMPILRYELLQRKEGDDGDWTTCDAHIAPARSSIAVRAVLPATEYRFKLRAEGPAGFGPWALLRGVRTDAAPPPPPTQLSVTSITHASVVLQWAAQSGGLAADAYDLQMKSSGEWQFFPRTVRQTAVRKMHLEPDTNYSFRVRAHLSSSGWGPWSREVRAKTLRLDRVVEAVRETAYRRVRQALDVRRPLALPTTSAPHHAMPRFAASSTRPGTAVVASPITDPASRLGIFVRRRYILQDTFDALVDRSPRDWARGTLVHFVGEPGLDYGAITREWLLLVLEACTDPGLALFSAVGSAQLSHPNPASRVQRDHVKYFRLFGRVLGKAFLEGVTVPTRLSGVVVKALLQQHGGYLADLQHHDEELHKSLTWILSSDITGVIEEVFCADVVVLGRVETIELVPGGGSIRVTQENKARFVEERARHSMLHGISEQMEALVTGFHEVRPCQ